MVSVQRQECVADPGMVKAWCGATVCRWVIVRLIAIRQTCARRSANIGTDRLGMAAPAKLPVFHWRIFDEIRQLSANTVAQLVRRGSFQA